MFIICHLETRDHIKIRRIILRERASHHTTALILKLLGLVEMKTSHFCFVNQDPVSI